MSGRQLQAGSQGDETQPASYEDGFFQDGVRYLQVTGKTQNRIRILPAYDTSYSVNDEAFATSFTDYRSMATVDELTNTPGFTGWYFTFMSYAFWGEGKKRFLSPLTGYPYPFKRGLDPIYDLYIHVKHGKDEGLKKALIKTGMQDDRPLYFPSTQAVVNALVENEKTKEWENSLVIFTQSALKDLKQSLKRKRGGDDKVISENWSKYMLGDITNPQEGCVLTPRQRQVAASGPPSACLCATFDQDDIEGYEPMAFDPASEQGQAWLKGRVNLTDDTKVLKFLEYDKILEWIVEDGVVPYSLVEEVCGNHVAKLPEPRNRPKAAPPADQGRQLQNQDAAPAKEATPEPAAKPTQAAAQQNAIQDSIQPQAVEEDDVPMDFPKEGDAPEGGNDDEMARFKELDGRIQAGENLASADVLEWSKLSQKYGSAASA
jgi:hypothetical protein